MWKHKCVSQTDEIVENKYHNSSSSTNKKSSTGKIDLTKDNTTGEDVMDVEGSKNNIKMDVASVIKNINDLEMSPQKDEDTTKLHIHLATH